MNHSARNRIARTGPAGGRPPRRRRSFRAATVAAALLLPLLAFAPTARATATPEGWRRWWLPANHSKHGEQIDVLFIAIFVVCSIVLIGVLAVMVRYCIKYRHKGPDTKAHFTHGNKRLELIWTVIPGVILLGLAVWTKGSWDAYRYAPDREDPHRAQVMVIAQQFAWNVIYPGPDGKFGKYLIFPKVTDLKWPARAADDADDLAVTTGVPGPAFLPPDKAETYIQGYIGKSQATTLGKDFADPAGNDDIITSEKLYVPKGRLVDVHLTSKDVLHSFSLPDYRVKLDAVPGMRGHVYFTAEHSSAELEKPTVRAYSVDELLARLENEDRAQAHPTDPFGLAAVVPADKAGTIQYTTVDKVKKRVRGKMQEVTEKVDRPLADGETMTALIVRSLKERGEVKEVTCRTSFTWDLVCQELCGNGHANMKGALVVLEPDEYASKYEGKSTPATPPASQPVVTAGR